MNAIFYYYRPSDFNYRLIDQSVNKLVLFLFPNKKEITKDISKQNVDFNINLK